MYLKKELYGLIKTDESIFDFIQESALDGLWYWDLENPENEWMNAKFWTVLGYDPDEMPHKSAAWQNIINQEDLKLASENLAKHCENPHHPYDQVVRYTHKNGSTVWIRCRGMAIRDKEGKPIRILGAHQDVSDIKNSELELIAAKEKAEESEMKFKAAFLTSPDSVNINKINGEFVQINEGFTRLTGYTEDDVIGRLSSEIDIWSIPSDRGKMIEYLEKDGIVENLESLFRAKDGTLIPALVSAKVIYFNEEPHILSVTRAIVDRKKMEQELIAAKEKAEESEKNLSITLNSIGDGVITTDNFGMIDKMNPVALNLCGWHEDEIKGKPLAEVFNIINAFTRKPVANPVEKVIEHGEIVGLANHTVLIAKDGREYQIADSAAPIKDKDGIIKGIVLVFSDVSEKYAAEEETRFQAHITENSPVITAYYDKELNMVWANKAYQKATGLSLKEIKGRKCYQVWNLSKPCNGCSVIKAIETGNNEACELTPDNQEHWPETQGCWLSQATPIRDAKNDIIGVIEFAIDITESKQSELLIQKKSEEIAVQNEELNQTNRQLVAAKEKAEESEYQLQAMINAVPDLIFRLNSEGVFLSYKAHEKDLYYQTDDLIGKDYKDVLPQYLVDILQKNIETVIETGQLLTFDYQLEIPRKGFRVFEARMTKSGKDEITTIVRDITENKLAVENLKKSEERFNLAMQASNDGLFDWNLETNDIYYSPSWKKMLGYEVHELPNDFSVWEKTTDPDDVKKSWELQQKLISKQIDRFVLEFKMKHKNGHLVDILSRAEAFFDNEGKAVRIVGTHTDITQRKQIEHELAESLERFKALHNASFGGIAIHDKGIILECNQGLSEMTGYSLSELIGMDGLLLIAPDNREMVMDNIMAGYEKPYEAIGIRKEGELFPLRLEARNIPYKGKNVRTVEFRDLTESKQAEEALRKAKEKAEESDKLKSAFLANMSHEIRTPMNGILGFAELLKEPELSGEQQQKYIQIIEKSGARMLNIINDIVSISKIESGIMDVRLTETNINDQLQFVYDSLILDAQNKKLKLSFNCEFPQKEAFVKTDSEKFYGVLSNLVKNAIKYTDSGSIEFGYEKKGNELQFYVKDTGIGIPKDKQKAIFERFIQADISGKMARQGAGLGLAISRAYVAMLGGKIWVERNFVKKSNDKGSIFYFTLPYNT